MLSGALVGGTPIHSSGGRTAFAWAAASCCGVLAGPRPFRGQRAALWPWWYFWELLGNHECVVRGCDVGEGEAPGVPIYRLCLPCTVLWVHATGCPRGCASGWRL